jgi:hypothetical protein
MSPMNSLRLCPSRTSPPLASMRQRVAVVLATLAVGAAILLHGSPAAAQQFVIHGEPAALFWVGDPQNTRFTPGFYFAIRPGVALGRYVALQASYALLFAPSKEGYPEDGVAQFILGGIRLRPFAGMMDESDQLGGLFIDGNAGYVRTGNFDRMGFDVGVGYGFQVAPTFSIGPVVRFTEIFQPNNRAAQDPNDARVITVGLDLAFGPAPAKPATAAEPMYCPDVAACPPATECPPPPECIQVQTDARRCADADADGVCDTDDRCPNNPGPTAAFGCPIDPCSGKPLVVLVQFSYDSAAMPAQTSTEPQTMDPVLDAVADAVAQDPSCRVCIIGHASEDGGSAYNQELSEKRARAVRSYMTSKGIAQSRLPATGLGERCNLVPERSLSRNRRVEFHRLQEGQSCPTDCAP